MRDVRWHLEMPRKRAATDCGTKPAHSLCRPSRALAASAIRQDARSSKRICIRRIRMTQMLADIGLVFLVIAAFVTLFAGFVKGAVGFAMPIIMISGLGSFMAPEIALATLILPTVAANLLQTFRGGVAAAFAAIRKFRLYLLIVLAFIAASAQLVFVLPSKALFLIVGLPVTLLSLTQLLGWRAHIPAAWRRFAEIIVAIFAGFIGGLSGVWGPPTVLYLTAINTPKAEQIRVQGMVYGSGALVLLVAHLRSGLLSSETLPLSTAMLAPALIGMGLGFMVQDRLDQNLFRRATLAVLVIAGMNLIRRGLIG